MDFESNAVDLESLDGSHTLGRRSFLIGALATGAAVSAPLNYAARARARAVPLAKDGTFKLGVASGFPRPRGDHALDPPRQRQGERAPPAAGLQ